ncbi:DNA-3-methyladenine glycosylase family protein [Haliscomenobacter sp.]|uniref:DNA-3-methyladenine glycosylase family protein n=1 Tax=Haliscomenobacter sp. TaxID=2717303 RepID=UPI003BAD7D22
MSTQGKIFLSTADEKLAHIISLIPEPLVESTGDVFFDLMSCILEQQIHYRSTKKTFAKMLQRAEIDRLTLQNFPAFEAKALGDAKLSLSKYETVLAVLDFFTENKLDWNALSDDAIRQQLSSIKGIGKWTIDMILLFTLNRPNVFPYDDFHLKQVMPRVYGLDPSSKLKAQMLEIASLWGNHRSLAVKYLLSWKDHQNKVK